MIILTMINKILLESSFSKFHGINQAMHSMPNQHTIRLAALVRVKKNKKIVSTEWRKTDKKKNEKIKKKKIKSNNLE